MSDTWVRNGELPWINQSNVDAFNQAEADYASDFDGDQDVSLIEIETNGIYLKRDPVGRLYADNSPFCMSATTQLTNYFGDRYSISAVEDFGEMTASELYLNIVPGHSKSGR